MSSVVIRKEHTLRIFEKFCVQSNSWILRKRKEQEAAENLRNSKFRDVSLY